MTTESTATPAQQIAAGYATQGPALELGTVVVDGTCDPTAQVRIPLATVNRHGLVAGATGTGKTKSLQVIAEQLSAAGVPVMMADVKGDLSGLSRPGVANDKTAQRAKDTGDDWTPTAFPVEFMSLGTTGIGVPVRLQSKIFRKFFRVQTDAGSGPQGTGLGLAIVDHVMRGHAGFVRVESEIGRGSTFTLHFPLYAGEIHGDETHSGDRGRTADVARSA